ncbi:MAG: hypothetical protein LWY06_14655 [Firmicutes bacterium]|nr:hypothetical protein [Bacillota bacterium]
MNNNSDDNKMKAAGETVNAEGGKENLQEGGSFVKFLLYVWKYKKIGVGVFLFFFIAGALFTFLSPKYYEAKTCFFFPVTSSGGDLLGSLGLGNLLNPSGDLSTYAVSILQGATISNKIIDKYSKDLFGKDASKPRYELLQQLPWIVKVKLLPSKIVEVSVETTDPKKSAEIANYCVEEYVKYSKSANLTLATQRRKNMEEQRDKVKKELYALENKLLAFQNRKKVVDPPSELQAMLNYYANIKAMSVTAEVNFSQSQGKLEAMRTKLTSQAQEGIEKLDYAQLIGTPAISSLYNQIVNKEADMAKLLQTRTTENPAAVTLQGEIDDLKKLLQEKIQSQLTGVQSDLTPSLIEAYSDVISQGAKRQALGFILKDLDRKFEQMPDLSYSYRRLNRDVLIKEKLLGYLELEVEKARSEEFKNPGEIQVLDKAVPPDLYSRPILRWYLLGTLIISVFMSLGAMKAADSFNKIKAGIKAASTN